MIKHDGKRYLISVSPHLIIRTNVEPWKSAIFFLVEPFSFSGSLELEIKMLNLCWTLELEENGGKMEREIQMETIQYPVILQVLNDS